MLAQRVVRDLAANQRVAHFARPVADTIRRGDRVFGLNKAQLELISPLADAVPESGVDRVDLRHHAEIALAVALCPNHADRRLMDQSRIGAKRLREADRLGRAAWVAVDKDWI